MCYDILKIESCLEKRSALGGVSPKQVAFAVDQAEKRLAQRDTSIVKVRPARLTDVEALEGMGCLLGEYGGEPATLTQ